MAKQHLSRYQKGIVNRYYEHRETIYATKLSELVSEIAVSEGEKKTEKLWKSAGEYLVKCKVPAADAATIVASRNVKRLAEIAGAVMTGRPLPRIGG